MASYSSKNSIRSDHLGSNNASQSTNIFSIDTEEGLGRLSWQDFNKKFSKMKPEIPESEFSIPIKQSVTEMKLERSNIAEDHSVKLKYFSERPGTQNNYRSTISSADLSAVYRQGWSLSKVLSEKTFLHKSHLQIISLGFK